MRQVLRVINTEFILSDIKFLRKQELKFSLITNLYPKYRVHHFLELKRLTKVV
jgi:hypothetical protein